MENDEIRNLEKRLKKIAKEGKYQLEESSWPEFEMHKVSQRFLTDKRVKPLLYQLIEAYREVGTEDYDKKADEFQETLDRQAECEDLSYDIWFDRP
jgi:hypothetical protein